MTELYPPAEPYQTGMFDADDGNLVYWETCGNPVGKPALVVHGGPGLGCTPGHRRRFGPARYQVVLFDQRMCGRSRPLADDPAVDLGCNTQVRWRRTWNDSAATWEFSAGCCTADRGGPRCCSPTRSATRSGYREIVITSVTTTRRSEIDWLYRGCAGLFPQEWERFRAGAGETVHGGDLITAYGRLMADSDPQVRAQAAHDWSAWEDATISLDPGGHPGAYSDRPPELLLARARLCAHFFSHGALLEEGELLANAHRLAGIPAVLIHGRMDTGGLDTAWDLAQAWPDAELAVIEQTGHSGSDAMTARQLAALDDFASR